MYASILCIRSVRDERDAREIQTCYNCVFGGSRRLKNVALVSDVDAFPAKIHSQVLRNMKFSVSIALIWQTVFFCRNRRQPYKTLAWLLLQEEGGGFVCCHCKLYVNPICVQICFIEKRKWIWNVQINPWNWWRCEHEHNQTKLQITSTTKN